MVSRASVTKLTRSRRTLSDENGLIVNELLERAGAHRAARAAIYNRSPVAQRSFRLTETGLCSARIAA
jgi:hypothetical protein